MDGGALYLEKRLLIRLGGNPQSPFGKLGGYDRDGYDDDGRSGALSQMLCGGRDGLKEIIASSGTNVRRLRMFGIEWFL